MSSVVDDTSSELLLSVEVCCCNNTGDETVEMFLQLFTELLSEYAVFLCSELVVLDVATALLHVSPLLFSVVNVEIYTRNIKMLLSKVDL